MGRGDHLWWGCAAGGRRAGGRPLAHGVVAHGPLQLLGGGLPYLGVAGGGAYLDGAGAAVVAGHRVEVGGGVTQEGLLAVRGGGVVVGAGGAGARGRGGRGGRGGGVHHAPHAPQVHGVLGCCAAVLLVGGHPVVPLGGQAVLAIEGQAVGVAVLHRLVGGPGGGVGGGAGLKGHVAVGGGVV